MKAFENNGYEILVVGGAIRDAILAISVDVYEVHISNIHCREEFRHKSYISDVAKGVVCGFGFLGYKVAIEKASLR